MLTRQLLDLLDLKSKTASLIAAQASLRAARSSAATATHGLREAQSTRTQGRAVILFTIVTVIFVGRTLYSTPLFLTGLTAPALVLLILLGQNVSEITGDDKNPSSWHLWRVASRSLLSSRVSPRLTVAAPISIVVIVVALLIAYYITEPDSLLWFWKRFGCCTKRRRGSQDSVDLEKNE
jgi:hypothetical protein